MPIAERYNERLTIWGAIKDLGWFFALYTLIVGGPSLLQIAQYAFPNFRLTPFVQWIPDGWRQLLNLMGDVVEPSLKPAIHWLADALHVEFDIDPVWRALFALMTVIWASHLRTNWRRNAHWRKQGARLANVSWVTHVLQLPGLLFGAVAAGLAMSIGGWLAQGLVVALPILSFQLFTVVAHLVEAVILAIVRSPNEREAMRQAKDTFVMGALLVGVGFALGACLSFPPGLDRAGGVLALAVLVATWGLVLTWAGLSRSTTDQFQDLMAARTGLTMLGGFIVAGLIAVADVVVRLLGGT